MKRRSRPSWLPFALGLLCGLGVGWALALRQQLISPPAATFAVVPPPVVAVVAAPHLVMPFDKLISVYGKRENNGLAFVFACTPVGGKLGLSPEADELGWYTLADLPRNTLPRHFTKHS